MAVEAKVGAGKTARSGAAYVVTAAPAQAVVRVGAGASPSSEVTGSTSLIISRYEQPLSDGCSIKIGDSLDFVPLGPLFDRSSISEERQKGHKNIGGLHFAER